MKQPDPYSGENRMHQQHRLRLAQIKETAAAISGTAAHIAKSIDMITTHGGQLQTAKQVAYLVGAMARLLKDVGVIEQLQSQEVRHRPREHVNGIRGAAVANGLRAAE